MFVRCPGRRTGVRVVRRAFVGALIVGALFHSEVVRAETLPDGADFHRERFDELSRALQERLPGPRAAAPLLELFSLSSELESLTPLAQVLTRVADDSRVNGSVRTLALAQLIELDRARGRLPKAKASLDQLAPALDAWIVGGFDNEGGTGHTSVYGPEQGPIDLNGSYPGKEREIRWRKVPALGLDPMVPVRDLLRPLENATFYALTTLEVPAATRATLYFGTSGATKLWVNGVPAFDDAADHPARFDQRGVSVSLRKGANVVLLKVSTLAESAAFTMRAANANGMPLAGARFVAPAEGASLAGVAPPAPGGRDLTPVADRPAPADDLVAQLQKLVQQKPNDAALQYDLALVLASRRPFDSKQQLHRRTFEKAAAGLASNPWAQLALAASIDDDHNERRAALERALAADPTFAPARTALGLYWLERGVARKGLDELTRAVADRPDLPQARLALAAAQDAMGFEGKARRTEFEAAQRFRANPPVVLAAARAEKSLGRGREAAERFRVVTSLRFNQREARRELASALVDLGDVDEAAATLRKAIELEPTAIPLGMRLAELLSQNGRKEAAEAEWARLAALAPDEESILEARGRHFLRAGDETKALEDFQHALVLKPQNAKLRELVRTVRPQENFAAPFLRDAVKLAAQARQAPAVKEDALVLAELTVVRVYPNGLSSQTKQQVVQVLSDRAVEDLRVQGVRYEPGDQEVRIESARLIKPDGSVVEARTETDRSANDSHDGMFFDQRQRIVSFPNLAKGDVVEFTYRKDDVGSRNMFADYFGDVEYLQGTWPAKDVEYVLVAPSGRTFYANKPTLPNVVHTEREEEGRRVLRWQVSDVPRVDPEPSMPGWSEVAAYLHVSTFKEWNDVGRFWWGLVREQLHVTPAVAAAAKEAVQGIDPKDVRARVRAVYGYVVSKTRYVGLEFGIHGFKPYPVDRVLARRFGDCKDKASLMYAMLQHLGIDSRLVLLRMRHLGHLDEKPASLAVFNHAILYVPSLDLFLDGTAEFSGSSELPGADQGAQVLVVDPGTSSPSKFFVTPATRATDNVVRSEYAIQLGPDGSATVNGTSEVRGNNASSWRRAYESTSGRREKFEQAFARSYPGAKVASVDISDARAIEQPVKTQFVLEVPRLARREGDALVFSPFGEQFHYVESLAPLSKRDFPIELGPPWRNEFRYVVKLPANTSPASVPEPVEASSSWGAYGLSIERKDGTLVVTGHVSIAPTRVSPADYPSFRSFLEEVDRTLSRTIRLAVGPVPAQASAGGDR